MNNLAITVYLMDAKKIVSIPRRNVYELSFAKTFKNRINRNQIHTVFWSADFKKEPDFRLPISHVFRRDVDACFHAKLIKAYGKF